MNLFGKAKAKPSAPSASAPGAGRADPSATIVMLRNSLDTLEKRENFIQKKIELALSEARQKAAKKDKKGMTFFFFRLVFCLFQELNGIST
jgi:hypothetical protein